MNGDGVAIIIVTYRRPVLLRAALASALRQDGVDNIVIVDNNLPAEREWASIRDLTEGLYPGVVVEDGRGGKVLRGKLAVHYRPQDDNLGGAGGFASGLEYVTAHAASRFVMFADDDAVLGEGAVARLLTAAADRPAAFWAPLIFNVPAGQFELGQHKSTLNPVTLDESHPPVEGLDQALIPLQANGFVGVMVETNALCALGGVFSGYFILYDDVDATFSLSSRLGPGLLVTSARIEHHFAVQAVDPYWKKVANIRSRLIFVGRHGRGVRALARRFRLFLTGCRLAMRATTIRAGANAFLAVATAALGRPGRFRPQMFA